MRNLKCTTIPDTWSHWNSNEKLKEKSEAIPGKHSRDSLQKTCTVFGTSHIIRKVLQCETCSRRGGNHRWFKGSIRKKKPVTSDADEDNDNDNDDNNNNNNNNNNGHCTHTAESADVKVH
jgi:hypothetical protein